MRISTGWAALGWVVAATVGTGCKKPEAPAPPPDRCSQIGTLADVMDCRVSPFVQGRSGDEAAFRAALQQLRELAPPNSGFNEAPRPWFKIVDDMLASRDYKRGCQECHGQFMKPYKNQYHGTAVPWVDPPAAPQ